MKNLKTLNSIIAILITSGLVACGGGSPSSSDDKPDSLLPPDLVLSSSSSSVASSDGSNSSSGGIVKTSLPIYENFEAIDIDNFLTANYKNLSTDTSLPFYYATSGYPLSTIPNGVPRILLTNWTSNALWFGNARFTLGQTRLEAETTTADPTVATWGELDLSRPYRLSFCVKDTLPSTSRRMMIFVDNNTSAQINSIHGNSNRIMYETTSNLTPGTRYSIESSVGTSTSFLQMRVESATDVIIDDLLLEYQDTPYTGAIPTCTADNSFVRPVATSSSVASSSAPSSSEAASSSTPTTSSSSSSSSEVVSSSSSSVDGGASSSDVASSSSAAAGTALLSEDFAMADTANFFTNAYKAIPTDASLPLYVATAGGTRVTFADGELSMTNARFTIGDKGGATAAGVQPNGSYDLTTPYRIKFTILAAAGTGNLQVYVDNNTTSAGSSIHNAIGSTASRLIQIAVTDITSFPHEVVIESNVGTATSFFQIRADSNVSNLTIDNLIIEHQ